jgi:tetratricopeptide (TPR) repeat protein
MYGSAALWHRFIHLEYLSVVGFAALVIGAWFCFRRTPGQRLRVFGAIWFAAAFLPISNLVPLNAQVAEHWIYLASIGYLTFLAGCVVALNNRWLKSVGCFVAIAVTLLGVRTAYRATDWADAETFYWRTINTGGGTPRICTVLANVYAQRGNYPEQERVLRRMIELFPDYTLARINLGTCLVKQGRAEEAKVFLDIGSKLGDEKTRQTTPSSWLAPLQLAAVRAQEGDLQGAMTIIRDAEHLFPGTWDLIKHEAKLFARAGNRDAAVACVERFVAEHWWHRDARLTLADLEMQRDAPDSAIEALRVAAALDVHAARPYAFIARAEIARERFEAARDAQCAAIRRDPKQPVQYLILAAILQKLGRDEEAREAQSKAHLLAEAAGHPLS